MEAVAPVGSVMICFIVSNVGSQDICCDYSVFEEPAYIRYLFSIRQIALATHLLRKHPLLDRDHLYTGAIHEKTTQDLTKSVALCD